MQAPLGETAANGIAIIGMAGRFPDAPDVAAFWRNLCAGVESIRRFTEPELQAAGVSQRVLRDPAYVAAGVAVPQADCFDAEFFGINPREAEILDPQQRLFLECAWEALEDAGLDPARFVGSVGVFAGAGPNTYVAECLARNAEMEAAVSRYQLTLANEKDFLPTRVAYKLDLRGPALCVQTACSTSLVAVHQACQSLLLRECDAALAGAASLPLPLRAGYRYEEGMILAPDGCCRAFDAAAAGTVPGAGVGVVALRRLADALAAGDPIHAVILGTAVNNDGAAKIGYTAPSVEGQAEVIALAQAMAGVSPAQVGFVEAHGTGTALGDVIEVQGLKEAFGPDLPAGSCALGAAKTNVGHADVASGMVGLIKAAMAVREGLIPPTLHFGAPNPRTGLDGSPFFVNTVLRSWEGPRIAGVSSFGIGGTNAHLVLGEAPAPVMTVADREQLLVVSARTPTALRATAERLSDHLGHNTDALGDVAWTLQTGRRAFAHRRAVVAADAAQAAMALRPPAEVGEAQPREVAFLFPGQGSQHAGMGAGLYRRYPEFRVEVDRCCDLLTPHLDRDLRPLMFGEAPELNETCLAQPALFVHAYALSRLWMKWGVTPTAFLGHSVGEYVAACLAGVWSLPDALRLIATRGRLMQALAPGAMTALHLTEADTRRLTNGELSVAAVNAPGLTVVSGPRHAIERLERRLESEAAVPFRRLRTSHAFHSAMTEPALDAFEGTLRSVESCPPQRRWVSNLTGAWISPEDATDPTYWRRHLREAVRFSEGVTRLLEDPGRLLLEVGPARVLSGLAAQNPGAAGRLIVPSCPPPNQMDAEPRALLEAAGRLWEAGVDLDWEALRNDEPRRRVHLPTYPFERRRCWVDPDPMPPPVVEPRDRVVTGDPDPAPSPHTAPPAEALPMPQPPPEEGPGVLSGVDLRVEIGAVVRRVSGVAAPEDAHFLELGFDSLLLVQLNQALTRRFGGNLTTARLLSDLGSIQALEEHFGAIGDRAERPAQQEVPRHEPGSERSEVVPEPQAPPGVTAVAHGPFRPLRPTGEPLTVEQRHFVARFAESYTRRTPGSRAQADSDRRSLADPRSLAGYHADWKALCYPIVAARAEGARLWDVDGNEYVDLVMGFGANLLGHSPPIVMAAVREQLDRSIAVGPQAADAGRLASRLCEMTGFPRAALLNTGSEAVMTAMRVARTVTGRHRVACFAGAYHGNFDGVLGRAVGSHTAPVAAGIPQASVADLLVLPYGEPEALEALRRHAHELAAVLVEPVQSRRPELQPAAFLQKLRSLTLDHNIALVFDEIVTGFRLHPRGAQGWFGIEADLATYGKVMGGGFPLGVLAGRTEYMAALDGGFWSLDGDSAPAADVTYCAGTFSKHPIAVAASLAVLNQISAAGPALQETLNRRTAELVGAVNADLEALRAPVRLRHCSSFFTIDFGEAAPGRAFLFPQLLSRGVHLWEGRVAFLSTAHTDEDLRHIRCAFADSVRELISAGFLKGHVSVALPVAPHPAESTPSRFPLSPEQEEVWMECRRGPETTVAYNDVLQLDLRGPLNQPALREALGALVERHAALRTAIAPDGAWQEAHAEASLTLLEEDLSHFPPEERAAARDARAERELGEPFDLTRAPLLRATLLRFADQEHCLLLAGHHLVFDGPGWDLTLRELGELYAAAAGARPADLAPPARYADFVAQRRSTDGRAASDRAEEYWRLQYPTLPEPLALPVDRPHVPERTYQSDEVCLALDHRLVQDLRAFAARERVTLNGVLLAAYQTLLHRISGQDDLTVGVLASATAASGLSPLIGHGANLLPLRFRFEPTAGFGQAARNASAIANQGFEHQAAGFARIVRALNPPRGEGRMPLVGAVFNVDAVEPVSTWCGGLHLSIRPTRKRWSPFDLWLNARIIDSSLSLDAVFNTGVLDAATVRRWLHCLRRLLESALTDPSLPVGRLALAEPEATGVEGEVATCAGSGIHELFEAQAARTPDHAALICGDTTLTYGELNRRAGVFAAHLRERGAGSGTRVALNLERSPEMVVAVLGVLKAGAAYVPLDPGQPVERRALVLREARPGLIVEGVEAGDCPLVSVPETAEASTPRPSPAGPDTGFGSAYVLFTSGSTGVPKGVEIGHGALVNFIESMRREPGLAATDRLLAVTTLTFDIAGLELFLPLTTGAVCVLATRAEAADARRLAELLEEQRITVLQATPATWQMLLASGWGGCPRLKALCGGEAMPVELARDLLPRCSELWNLYGPTETTIWSALHRVTAGDLGGPIPIGRPIANTRVYVLDARGEPVPAGVTGELWIGGAGLARGYLHQPDLTAARFRPDPFAEGEARMYRTGDLARRRADGLLECLGRTDYQVKLRGYRIELGEIEAALRAQGGVRQAVVIRREDAPGAPRLVGYVTGENLEAASLRRAVSAALPDYMVPAAVLVLEALPLTPNGKIERNALPAPDSGGGTVPARRPLTPMEERLTGLWRELGLTPAGPTDTFWDVGGHSLLAVRLFVRIEEDLGIRLPLSVLFRADTVQALADVLLTRLPAGDEAGPEPTVPHPPQGPGSGHSGPTTAGAPGALGELWSPLVPIQPAGTLPTLFLVHGGAGDVLDYRLLSQRLGPEQPVFGLQAQGLDGSPPLATVEAMAEQYLAEVRRRQPDGPYYLAGECFGGMVAFEMAHRLRAAGETVAFLGLIDTYSVRRPNGGLGEERFGSRVYRHMYEIDRHMGRLMAVSGREQRAYFWAGVRSKAASLGRRLIRRRTPHPVEMLPPALRAVREATDAAGDAYRPQPYPGRLTLILAAGQPYRCYDDRRLTWTELAADGAEVRLAPGDHLGMIREPHVGALAEILAGCLRRARRAARIDA